MKKSRIIFLALLTTIALAGCSNNQDKQIQQQNDLLKQQNTLLQQQGNQQDILLQQQGNQQDTNTNTAGYTSVTDNTNTPNDINTTGNTKTIPFTAVEPANNVNNNNNYSF